MKEMKTYKVIGIALDGRTYKRNIKAFSSLGAIDRFEVRYGKSSILSVKEVEDV